MRTGNCGELEMPKKAFDETDFEEDVVIKMPPKSKKKAIMIVGTKKESPCCINCRFYETCKSNFRRKDFCCIYHKPRREKDDE